MSAQFDHYGVPTSQKMDGATYLEGAKVHITDPAKHPFRIEFLYFEPGSPMLEDVQKIPHAAFIVPSLDDAIKGQSVIIPPFDATDTLRCAFIKDGEAIIEVMERK